MNDNSEPSFWPRFDNARSSVQNVTYTMTGLQGSQASEPVRALEARVARLEAERDEMRNRWYQAEAEKTQIKAQGEADVMGVRQRATAKLKEERARHAAEIAELRAQSGQGHTDSFVQAEALRGLSGSYTHPFQGVIFACARTRAVATWARAVLPST